MPKITARSALPGCGSNLISVAAAMRELSQYFDFVGHGGTSGGGMIALSLASGMTPDAVVTMVKGFLARHDLLDSDFSLEEITGTGLYRGHTIEHLLQQTLGANTKLGQLKYPCRVTTTSMWISKAAILCSQRHPDIEAWRAGRATSCIEGFFDLIRVRPDNARTYGDGGLMANNPAGIWDDHSEPVVFIRLKHQEPITLEGMLSAGDGDSDYKDVAPVRNKLEVIKATANMALNSGNATLVSRKPPDQIFEVVIDTDENGLNFNLSQADIDRREKLGRDSALKFIAANLARLVHS